jgi:signal transduction histidine kinase
VTVQAVPHRTLPPEVQVAFYRIAQEALNNVAKHAEAQHVEVDLRYIPPSPAGEGGSPATTVELCVADDGRGFDPALLRAGSRGLGLGIMRERAAAVGAAIQIQSQPGQGTRITVIWSEED